MAEKNRTPDILGSVLSGPAATPVEAAAPAAPKTPAKRRPAHQQAVKPEDHMAGKTARQHSDKMAEQQDRTPSSETDKIKATFYLAPEAVEGLEDAWLQLRRQARGASRKRAISKSEIVEAALQIMLEDLEAHGKASRVAGKLLSRSAS